jgi:SRSO17 transposase
VQKLRKVRRSRRRLAYAQVDSREAIREALEAGVPVEKVAEAAGIGRGEALRLLHEQAP